MPDFVANINGRAAFASFRENPWHKLGEVFEEKVTGREMLQKANLDWDVQKIPLVACVPSKSSEDEGGDVVDVQGYRLVTRDVDGAQLGIVGEDFELYQNREIIDYFEGLRGSGDIVYETAGALHDGRLVWVMARIPDLDFSIKGDDTYSYMLISNGHAGNASLWAYPTNVRVVCANTMAMAASARRTSSGLARGYSIRHTRNMRNAVKDVQKAFDAIRINREHTVEILTALADVSLTDQMKDQFFDYLINPTAKTEGYDNLFDEPSEDKRLSKRSQTIRSNKRDQLETILAGPTNQLKGTRDTAYSLLQAGVEYIDHERPTQGDVDRARFESSVFGSGRKLKGQLFDKILELAK